MKLRIRILREKELQEALYDGQYLLRLYSSGELDFCVYGVLQYESGESSVEGPSWADVEVEYS